MSLFRGESVFPLLAQFTPVSLAGKAPRGATEGGMWFDKSIPGFQGIQGGLIVNFSTVNSGVPTAFGSITTADITSTVSGIFPPNITLKTLTSPGNNLTIGVQNDGSTIIGAVTPGGTPSITFGTDASVGLSGGAVGTGALFLGTVVNLSGATGTPVLNFNSAGQIDLTNFQSGIHILVGDGTPAQSIVTLEDHLKVIGALGGSIFWCDNAACGSGHQVEIGVATNAGSPNRMNLPTTTGGSGQVLSTDGANPQQLSWITTAKAIASGTATLTSNAALAAVTSQTAITVAGAGILTTDGIEWSYATAPTAGDSLCHLSPYVTSGNVNFVRTNPTAAAQNVSAIVVNWRVIR